MDEEKNNQAEGGQIEPQAQPEVATPSMEGGTVNETPQAFTPAPEPTPASNKSFGPVFGIIIIVILIVLAGFYFWGGALMEKEAMMEEAATTEEAMGSDGNAMTEEHSMTETETETSAELGAPLSGSDEVADLETDLESTDLSELDAELEQIDQELQSE